MEAEPVLPQNPPTGQSLHALEPGASANLPMPHAVHVTVPVLGACAPRAQSKQSAEPLVCAYLPASHTTHFWPMTG